MSEKILIVDDDPLIVRYLADILGGNGYTVETASDGMAGIVKAREMLPDLILLDMIMPGMTGFEVTAGLKKDPLTSFIPIVLITSLNDPKDKVKGLDAGADDFITKPFDSAELRARIRSLIKLKGLTDQLRAIKGHPEFTHASLDQTLMNEKSTILLIEDDDNSAKYYSRILISKGYAVLIAKKGTEALYLIENSVVDLIMLDIMLPDINGLEILKKIRSDSNPSIRDIPIIITSVISDPKTKVAGIESGADDYLVKPVNHAEMLARIRANLRRKIISRRIEEEKEVLFNRSVTDPLTGLFNRLYFRTVMERAIAASKRFNMPYSLLMMDIDDFKIINDSFGHLTGDNVLKEIGRILQGMMRACDIAVRYGGEEFAVLLTDNGIEGACHFAERLRDQIECCSGKETGDNKITVSIGLTQFKTDDSCMEDIIKRADEALYMAKKNGKNRVEMLA